MTQATSLPTGDDRQARAWASTPAQGRQALERAGELVHIGEAPLRIGIEGSPQDRLERRPRIEAMVGERQGLRLGDLFEQTAAVESEVLVRHAAGRLVEQRRDGELLAAGRHRDGAAAVQEGPGLLGLDRKKRTGPESGLIL